MVQDNTSLLARYKSVRRQTVALTEGLAAEDLCAQSMPDASPAKWHLAHTTWFFETFLLQKFQSQFCWHNESFCFLFNSYYDSVGDRHARPQRGLLTRPYLQEVMTYRSVIDEAMCQLIESRDQDIEALVTIGLHHEMQHQELLLTDLLHLFSFNPTNPAVIHANRQAIKPDVSIPEMKMKAFDGGLIDVGAESDSTGNWSTFSYDCEQPRHQSYLMPFKLGTRLVANAEWIDFINDGGYGNPLLWLSDGWAVKNKENWQAPLYWEKRDDVWWQFGLDGLQQVDQRAPVHHVSFYEADAFARWSGKRLPREFELEHVAESRPISGNFLESHTCRPFSANTSGGDFEDIYGDVWEWTQSAYSAYPGFDPKQGALGEYNGKFMANQFVLKGGSCVTPRLQLRASYRNFFYPHQRWQFSGLRLAEDY